MRRQEVLTGGEKVSLHISLKPHRDAVLWKVDGLDDERLRQPMTPGTAWWGSTVSMRWVLIHMVEDTARHAGHMDILREHIDGQTGDRP